MQHLNLGQSIKHVIIINFLFSYFFFFFFFYPTSPFPNCLYLRRNFPYGPLGSVLGKYECSGMGMAELQQSSALPLSSGAQ